MYYRQPRYFGEFQCVGGDCLETCCYGWRIDWKKEEVDKVKNAKNISSELKELVEKSFMPNLKFEERLQIEFNEQGKCPLQTAEGLCRIQKELGAEYLSHTCMFYPRHELTIPEFQYRFMHLSCCEVIKKMLFEQNSCDLTNVRGNNEFENSDFEFLDEVIKKRPEIRYLHDTFEFFYELISDKKIPIETAIIFGALAAQKLTKISANGQYDIIPKALKAFRKQFHNATQLKTIDDISPNYYLKFGFLSELFEIAVGQGVTVLLHDQTGTPNIDLYNRGEQGLHEALKGREFFLRNLALNLLFEFNVPFKFEDRTIFENYSLFAAAFGLLKLNLIAVCSDKKGITIRTHGQEFVYYGDDKLIGMTAIICRGICQSEDKQKAIIGLMNDNKFTTPAYLALLIK